MLISSLSILLGWGMLINSIGLNSKSAPTAKFDKYLRLMTYNVHNFSTIDSPANLPAYKSILNVINEQQPDIVTLTEFYLNPKRFKICDSLQKAMHSPYYYFQPYTRTIYDSTGIAIFSKYPIVRYKPVPISPNNDEGECIYVDVNIKGCIVRIYCVHLQSIKFEAADYKDINSLAHFKPVKMQHAKHILSKIKYGFQKRGEQAEILKQTVLLCPYPYIIAGDFNDVPSSYTYNKISSGLKNSFREKGSGIIKTYRGDITGFQIDYILTSSQFGVVNYNLIKKDITDHYPVCADLILNYLK